MSDTNQRLNTLEDARRNIEENLIVMAHLETGQSRMLKEHAVFLAEHERTLKEVDSRLNQMTVRGAETDIRIERLVSAIGTLVARP